MPHQLGRKIAWPPASTPAQLCRGACRRAGVSSVTNCAALRRRYCMVTLTLMSNGGQKVSSCDSTWHRQ
eukprot:2674880-Pleurochrysis_carterae.AAC.1